MFANISQPCNHTGGLKNSPYPDMRHNHPHCSCYRISFRPQVPHELCFHSFHYVVLETHSFHDVAWATHGSHYVAGERQTQDPCCSVKGMWTQFLGGFSGLYCDCFCRPGMCVVFVMCRGRESHVWPARRSRNSNPPSWKYKKNIYR